jgi:hypothetical protein
MLAVIAVACLGAAAAAPAYAVTNPIVWGGPTRIDHQKPWTVNRIAAASCPSASFCAAVDGAGDVLTSGNPTGGAPAWAPAGVSRDLVAISCPTTQFCAVAGGGVLGASTNPAGGAGAWTWHPIVNQYFNAISCASASLCVAVDDTGGIWTSTNPGSDPSSWSPAQVFNANASLTGVSCTAKPQCVVTSDGGSIAWSTNPTGGSAAWSTASIDQSRLTAVSCPADNLCVATDGSGGVMTSTNPTGGAGAWTRSVVDGSTALVSVSCAGTACAAGDGGGAVLTTANAAGGSWGSVALGSGQVLGVACGAASLCVAGDDAGDLFASANPTGGRSAWSGFTLDGFNSIYSISCASAGLCVAADTNGNLLASTTPAQGGWKAAPVDPSNSIYDVACPSEQLCVAVDTVGNALTATSPASGSWTSKPIDAGQLLTSVACATPTFCAAVDASGNVLTTANPAGDASAWTRRSITTHGLTAIACPNTTLCVATDDYGEILSSPAPADPNTAWTTHKVDGNRTLSTVACTADAALCLAGGQSGYVWGTTTPTGSWLHHGFKAGVWIYDIACTGDHVCVVGDDSGGAWASSDPTNGLTSWTRSTPDGGEAVDAVACPTDALCFAADTVGNLVVGTMAVPEIATPPVVTGLLRQGQTLSTTSGSWTNKPSGATVQWLRCTATGACQPIPGATGATYQLTAADIGMRMQTQAVATNAGGTSKPALSALTGPVAEAPYGQLILGRAGVRRHKALVPLRCRGAAGEGCTALVTLTTRVRRRGARIVGTAARKRVRVRRVTLEAVRTELTAGDHYTYKLSIASRGQALLKHVRRLHVRVQVVQVTPGGRHLAIGHRSVTIRR